MLLTELNQFHLQFEEAHKVCSDDIHHWRRHCLVVAAGVGAGWLESHVPLGAPVVILDWDNRHHVYNALLRMPYSTRPRLKTCNFVL